MLDNKYLMLFSLFKFEVKRYLKDVMFWCFMIITVFMCMHSAAPLFRFPIINSKQVYNNLHLSSHMDSNVYHVLLRDIYEKYDDIVLQKTDKKIEHMSSREEWEQFNKVENIETKIMNDVNDRFETKFKGYRFSQIFFKILSSCFSFFPIYVLMVIFSLVWSKDKSSNMLSIVKVKPIKTSSYLLVKFMACFLPYISILFLLFLGVGIFEKVRMLRTVFEFRLLDMIIPFFVFVIPTLLYTAILVAFFSIVFSPVISGSIYLFIYYFIYQYCIGVFNSITGEFAYWVYIPPIRINYGLNLQIILLIASVLLYCLSCYFWERKLIK